MSKAWDEYKTKEQLTISQLQAFSILYDNLIEAGVVQDVDFDTFLRGALTGDIFDYGKLIPVADDWLKKGVYSS